MKNHDVSIPFKQLAFVSWILSVFPIRFSYKLSFDASERKDKFSWKRCDANSHDRHGFVDCAEYKGK